MTSDLPSPGVAGPDHAGPHLPNPLEALSLEQLRTRTSEKWRRYSDDILPLWVAEMDVVPARPVIDVVHRAMTTGDTGYPSGDVYAQALQEFASRRWDWDGFETDRTVTVPDVMHGIVAALNVIADPTDAVIVCSPVYPPFYAYVRRTGRTVLEAPLGPDGRMDPEAIRAAFAEARTTSAHPVLLLANPHNPTGVAHRPDELAAVAGLAREYGGRVISDEIHAPLVLDGSRVTPFLSVPGAENGFSVFSASKAWNLPGLKAAVLAAGPEAAAEIRRVPATVTAGASHLGILAHTTALREGGDWLEALLKGLGANRDLVFSLVQQHLPGVKVRRPEATYLAWLDCTGLELPDAPADSPARREGLSGPSAFFFDRAGVALNDGAAFGTGGRGCARLNFGTSAAILHEAIDRMGRALESCRRG